ncbi:MAG: ABC transporter ATP-binding protein, partial [Candidatus Tectomicrobia bacterium]|nr:ABC transporter ATP-binding protein [Candidatus Tectomicrobia bacterium]
MEEGLVIKDLHVSVEGNEILRGLDLSVKKGEIHALMGPNGSGKSTLAYTIMGHPGYQIDGGDILLNGESILEFSPDERAKKGLFLAFQYPTTIPGVTVSHFLRTALKSKKGEEKSTDRRKDLKSVVEFHKLLTEKMKLLKIDESFSKRYLNEGFSGGEKKRAEILQ